MSDAMVTGRMDAQKKAEGNTVLDKSGLNASQAINMLYDRLTQEQSADFLTIKVADSGQWQNAAMLVDSIVTPEPGASRGEASGSGQGSADQAEPQGRV